MLLRTIYCITFILGSFSATLMSQVSQQVTATGHITAEVVAALSAVETSQLNFGRFSPGPYGGQLVMTPQGSVSVLGSVVSGSGLKNAASFYVTGNSNATFSITLPDESAVLTNTTNARTLRVSNWVSVPAPGQSGAALENGFQTIYIGATLNVGTLSDNPVGIYTGTYTVTFDFN